VAEYERSTATFLGLGERGKPAETVADDAVEELLTHHESTGAVDAYTADQIAVPLALAEGRSVYTVSHVTEHLRTNLDTIRAFVDRPMRVEESREGPARVVIG
jgi:RNA 3'-terminal phosphate cyclase (ATP)